MIVAQDQSAAFSKAPAFAGHSAGSRPAGSRSAARRAAALAAPMLLAVAGCAGGLSRYVPSPANAVFSLSPSARAITTNGQARIKALTASGGAAAVGWSVVGGQNDGSLGQGSIDADGNYTPPSALAQDSIQVEIQAQLKSDPTKTATEVIEVTPGFLQPLTPENAALAAGDSIEVTAQLAEVGGGSVEWQLAAAPSGGRRLGSAYGSLGQESCLHSARDYTVCSAVYTAPPTTPDATREVYVVATLGAANSTGTTRQPLHILLGAAGGSSTPLAHQSPQTSLVQLGASGGNNNDADTAQDGSENDSQGRSGAFINDCCGGTLGALLRDESGGQYILSNNHVLAESDQAKVGDAIVQPALIDRNCDQNAARPVASLRYVVPLATAGTNVDAALAEVNAGTVDPSGAILELGAPGVGPNGTIGAAAPAAGLGEAIAPDLLAPGAKPLLVAKSGRTTGLTCSSLDAVDLSIQVDYYKDCAETQPYYRKTFAGQLGVSGGGFSDSGDSGALLVDAANAEPLGLYFAGGTDDRGGGFSVASPIQDVLAALDAEAGRQFSVVGGAEHPVSCLNYDRRRNEAPTVPEALRRRAEAAARKSGPALIDPAAGILDVAVGASADSPGDPAVIVYVDKAKENVEVPQTVGGIRTVIVATDQGSLDAGTAPQSAAPVSGIHLQPNVLEAARQIQRANVRRLMADPAIFGVGVAQSRDNPAEAALLVLVDLARAPRATPAVIGGLRVRYLFLHRFHVTKSRYAGAPHPSSCALRSRVETPRFDPEQVAPIALPFR
jgi:hypothetical protein